MKTIEAMSHDSPAVMELDLMPYINALIDARWKLVIAALLSAVLASVVAYSKPYMFQSTIKVSVVDIEDPGGVSPDDRMASEVLTLVEHGFVMGTTRDNYNDVMLARLRSRNFTMKFIDEHNVYRHFYPEQWLEKEQRWEAGFTPDRGEIFTLFRDGVRSIVLNEETDILSVGMNWPEPTVARDWANNYVRSFNEFIRERTIRDVQRKQEYLQSELHNSDLLEMQKSIYRLIEAQTAIAMLANAREEYALEIIDPAAIPYRSFMMSRKMRIAIGTVAGTLLAIFAVLASVLLSGMLQKIILYRAHHQEVDTSPGLPK
ncbi:MAG: chain-length determining protein [Halioglobus sp.]